MGARQLCFKRMHAALEAQRGDHLGHLRVVTVVADAHSDLVLKVDAVYLLQKTMHKVLAALLSIAHHVQPSILLRLDPQQCGIGLGLLQFGACQLPLGPELFGFRQPGRLGQATGNRSFKHVGFS